MEMQKRSLTQLAPTHSLHSSSPSYPNRKLFSPERLRLEILCKMYYIRLILQC